jgi:hypothetical protein
MLNTGSRDDSIARSLIALQLFSYDHSTSAIALYDTNLTTVQVHNIYIDEIARSSLMSILRPETAFSNDP